jgi:hypothetical protein
MGGILLAGAIGQEPSQSGLRPLQTVALDGERDYLAIILVAGAAGLLLGLFWAPIGITATVGVVLYFLVAIAFHIRADDAEHLPTPVVMELIAVAVLALQLA